MNEKIKTGDKVLIEFLGPDYEKTGETLTGVLTYWDETPWCEVDGKSVDLAGEGHSSTMKKIKK